MRAEIALLKADVKDELAKMQKLFSEFKPLKGKLKLMNNQISSYDKAVIGYILHNFYNGCENIFQSIARFFENDIGPSSWHRDLLKRMTLEIEGVRPKAISDQLYQLLDDFRGFRHKFRHSYTFELDWEREKLVAGKLETTWSLFRTEINQFLDTLNAISETPL